MRAFDVQPTPAAAGRTLPTSAFSPAPALDIGRGLTGPELRQLRRSEHRARLILAGVVCGLALSVAGIAYGATRTVVDERTRRYSTGVPMVHGYYIGGTRQGEYTSFYRNGGMKAFGRYHNNLRTGFWRTFYFTGELRSMGPYKKNVRVGEWRTFYRDGTLSRVETFNDSGRADGRSATYYENGSLEHEMEYANGVFHGVERVLSEAGHLITEVTFEVGVPHGAAAYFYSNGMPFMRGTYVAGERDGEWTISDGDTGLTEVFVYENGEPSPFVAD